MTPFLVYIIVSGLIGWVASIVMRTNRQQGIMLNIVVGIIGTFIAGFVLTPLFGISTIGQGNCGYTNASFNATRTRPCNRPCAFMRSLGSRRK